MISSEWNAWGVKIVSHAAKLASCTTWRSRWITSFKQTPLALSSRKHNFINDRSAAVIEPNSLNFNINKKSQKKSKQK